MVKKARKHPLWFNEIDDLVRGASGGFLFGIPLLYTMEVWWIGSFTSSFRKLGALVITYVAVFLLNRTAGFRKLQGIRSIDAAMDSIEAMAIGLICSACILILLQEITLETPLNETLGKLIFEAVPFSLGVALANQFLRGEGDAEQGTQQRDKTQNSDQDDLSATLTDIGGTLIGATIIAFNIAPTDEIPMLATAASPPWLLAIIAASLLISYSIVFEAGFANQEKRQQQQGIFQRPLSETVISYLVSLMAAVCMLCFFEKVSFDDPWSIWLSYTLLLGLPATIGGAAGRLAV
jgi:putative integral membrane protein (TIGR02587 family)